MLPRQGGNAGGIRSRPPYAGRPFFAKGFNVRLRSIIFLILFALGILPLFTLIAINLSGHIERHEQTARDQLRVRLNADHAILNKKNANLTRTFRQAALALGAMGPAASPSTARIGRFNSLMGKWFQADLEVLELRFFTLAGQEQFRLGRNDQGEMAPVPAGGHGGRPLPESLFRQLLQQDDDLHVELLRRSPRSGKGKKRLPHVLLIATPVTGPDQEKLGLAVLSVDFLLFLKEYLGDYWITPDGGYLHRPAAGPANPNFRRTAGSLPVPNSAFDDFPGIGDLMADSQPFILEHGDEQKVAWIPLAFNADRPVAWLGKPIDRSAAQQWKKSLILSIVWIVAIMMIIILFIASGIAAKVDRIKQEMVTGLDRILNREKPVRFEWTGPKELRNLAEELTLLANRYVQTSAARKKAEAALRESEDKFRNLTTSAQDAIMLMDHQGNISFWNKAAAEIFGFSHEEALGRPIHTLIDPRRIDTDEDDFGHFKATEEGAPIRDTLELMALRKNGTEVPIELSLSAGHIKDQWHAIWIVRDISERKKAEKKTRLQQQQLIQADKMISLGLLVSGVAHEINNPNSIAMLNGPMLARAWQSAQPILDEYYRDNGDFMVAGLEYSEMRQQIPRLFVELEDSAKRIKDIVQDLKDYARQDTTRHMGAVDINEITRAAVRLTYNTIKNSTKHFVTHYTPDLPPVKGNRQRLEQVIVNLIQNSCEALPDDQAGMAVSTFYHPREHTVEIQVMDEGLGIPAEIMHRIFDPFFTTKRTVGGTGLGLSVSAGIVKEHNGVLRFTSSPGRETVAIVTLPAIHDTIEERS